MQKENTVIYHYRYQNRQKGNVQIWMAVPPATQRQVIRHVDVDRPPIKKSALYGQQLWFYDLAPGESVNFEAELDLYSASLADKKRAESALSEDERSYYLRSGLMSPVNGELKKEAQDLAGGANSDLETAKRLFKHLHHRYIYKYPPKKRGAVHFREAGKGDCGEFSFLYTSYMRSLGIPCRTVVGAFLKKFNPHVWNEVWIDEIGWLPVDTSLPAALKKPLNHILFPLQMGERTKKDSFFGHFEGKRVIFSLDSDWPLDPAYQDNRRNQPKDLFVFGKELDYGFESLEGNAPYLQPIYTRFQKDVEPKKMVDLLGTWAIKETDKTKHALSILKQYMYYVFFIAMFASAFGRLANIGFLERLPLSEIGYGAAMAGLLAAILRKEANWAVYLLAAATFAIGIRLFWG
jgi:transglutaminase-like putative cysteine protease